MNDRSYMNEVTYEVVGKRNRNAVDGMSRETALLCDQRRESRKQMREEPTQENRDKYTSLNKEVKKAIVKQKLKPFRRKFNCLESNINHRNDSQNLLTVRKLEGKPKKPKDLSPIVVTRVYLSLIHI